MLTLDRPMYTALQTFTACISRVRDPLLKVRLQGVTQAVVDAALAFDTAAASQTLHAIARGNLVGGTVTTYEMTKVYTQRMARVGSAGRYIYDELITAPAHGRCPLCGHNSVTMLDHHLPKAHYPALAVTPLNLVPSCGDCNKAKLDSIPSRGSRSLASPVF